MRDPRYDVLFEPVPMGPVTARNRFFQVPHCNGMGHLHPSAHAEMRGVKAEGGWAVVCTEEVELHHSTDVAGYVGSGENRTRLLRQILEDTVETVAGRAAVACRICVDERLGEHGIDRAEIEAVLGLVGELPDVWDFMVGEWEFDSVSSRFAE